MNRPARGNRRGGCAIVRRTEVDQFPGRIVSHDFDMQAAYHAIAQAARPVRGIAAHLDQADGRQDRGQVDRIDVGPRR